MPESSSNQKQVAYTLFARYREGHWLRRFVVKASSAEGAAQKFDTSEDNDAWIRVSSATLNDEV